MPVTAIAKQSSGSGAGNGTGPKVPFKKMFSSSHLMHHSIGSSRQNSAQSNVTPSSGVSTLVNRAMPLVSLSHQLSQHEALSSSLPDVAITSANQQFHSVNDSRSSQRSALSSTSRSSGETSGSLSVISSNPISSSGNGSFTSGDGNGRRPSRAILAATALEPSMIVTLSNYLGTLRKFDHDKLVKEILLMLNYFEDVVVKDKLELLVGACTIILEALDRNCALLRSTYQQLQQVQLRLQLLHNSDDNSHEESTSGKSTVIEATNKLYSRMSELLQWSDQVSTTHSLLPSETSDDSSSSANKSPTNEAEKASNVAQAKLVAKNLHDAFNDLITSYRAMESDFRQSFEECLHANKQIVDMILAESNSAKQLSNIRRRSITPPPDYNRKLSDRPLTNGSTSTIASSASSNASSNSSSFLRGPHRFFPTLISNQAQKMAHHIEKKFSKNNKTSKSHHDGTTVHSANSSGQKPASGWSGFLPRLTGSNSNLRRAGSASEIARSSFLDLPDTVCPEPSSPNQFRKLSINELSPRKITTNRHSDGATPTSDKESPRAGSRDASPKTEMLWNPIYFDTSRFHNSSQGSNDSKQEVGQNSTMNVSPSDSEKPPPLPPKTYRTSGRSSNASMNSSSGSSLTHSHPPEVVKVTTPPNTISCSSCRPVPPVCKCQTQNTQNFGEVSPEFPNVTLRRKRPPVATVPEVITTCCCGDPARHQMTRHVSPPPLPPPDLFPPRDHECNNANLGVKTSTPFQAQTSVVRTYRRETYHARAHRSYSIAAESILVSPTMDSLQVVGRTIPASNSFHSRLAHSKSMFGGTPPPLPPKRRNMAEYMVMIGNYNAATPGSSDFTHFYSGKARLDPRSQVVMSTSLGSISSSDSSTSSSFCTSARQSTFDPLNDQQQYDHLPVAPPPPIISEPTPELQAPKLPPRKEAKKAEPPPARPQKTVAMVEPRSITPPEIKQALICDCIRVVPPDVEESADETTEIRVFVGADDSMNDSIIPEVSEEGQEQVDGLVIEEPEPEITGCRYCSEHGDHAEDDCVLAQIDVPSSALEFRGQKSAVHGGDELHEESDVDLGDLSVVAGTLDALLIRAAQSNPQGDEKTFYWTFLLTYRTILSPEQLIEKLIFRYRKLSETTKQRTDIVRQALASKVVAFILTIVDSFYIYDLSPSLSTRLMDFIYQLVGRGDLGHAKELREKCYSKMRDREREIAALNGADSANSLRTHNIKMRSATLLDFKSEHLAEQMTFLDARLFHKIEISELLIWARDQREDLIPHLSCFTEHFNKMSFWTRSLILDHEDPKERERYAMKFLKIMKHLRKLNNFNSYLAILSALGSAPVSRLDWPKNIEDTVNDYQALIDSSSSFRTYRTVLAVTKPPCIPYIGLILQDLTFVHIGNPDMRRDGLVNLAKRYKQFTILQQMQRFQASKYSITENEVITGFFDNFDQYHPEEVLWQLSESIRPRGGGTNSSSTLSQAS